MKIFYKSGKKSLAREFAKPTDEVEVEDVVCDGISPLTENGDVVAVQVVLKVVQRGRPKGSTNKARDDREKATDQAYIDIATEYQILKGKALRKCKKLPNRCLEDLIERVEIEYNLKKGTINPYTIKSRVRRNNLTGQAHQKTSPLHFIEPFIVQWCLAMAKCGSALNRQHVIDLACDLIKGTKAEQDMIEFKRQRGFIVKEEDRLLGVTWYQSFMRRHSDTLRRGRCVPKDVNRHTWCTKEHFSDVYDHVYDELVTAGIAEKLEEEVMYNKNGELTTDVSTVKIRVFVLLTV
jgi:hypothetical protein